jgi:cyanophycinase
VSTVKKIYLRSIFLLILAIFFGLGVYAYGAQSGSIVLVGDVLSYKQREIWKRIFELAGGDLAEIVVISAAHERAKLYGGYAVRALTRYGPLVELLPVAVSFDEFKTDYREAVHDPELINRVQRADVVFFVGGSPKRLSTVMFNKKGSPTPLATAVRDVYTKGGVIVGGIPGAKGADTYIDAMQALLRGEVEEERLYQGLSLLEEAWYIDQQISSPGRFIETVVAMRQLRMGYGIGVSVDSAAVIRNGYLEAVGESGVFILDLSSTTSSDKDELNIKGGRISHLVDGDRLDLTTLQVTPNRETLDGFEIDPNAVNHQPMLDGRMDTVNMLTYRSLATLLGNTLDGESKETLGVAFPDGLNENDRGFQFRFYVRNDTRGWLTTRFGDDLHVAHNIYLDVIPISKNKTSNLMQ